MGKDGAWFQGRQKEKEKPPEPVIPGPAVIPIIFVPGIMGSNLAISALGKAKVEEAIRTEGSNTEPPRGTAWVPPNVKAPLSSFLHHLVVEAVQVDTETVATSKRWEKYGPAVRQALLNPDTTETYWFGFVPELPELRTLPGRPGHESANNRGWGSVHWQSYGDFLRFLEFSLNPFAINRSMDRKHIAQSWRPNQELGNQYGLPEDVRPSDEELENAARFRYPVIAFGYNWTQSNYHSAISLLRFIDLWVEHFLSAGFPCSQVVLVTHSMGGLVARTAMKMNRRKILGVIHGVMPAIGAPVAYRRMVAGWDPASSHPIYRDLRSTLVRLGGRTSPETTAVMANCPGVLELLPSHLYPPGWLQVEQHSPSGIRPLFQLPTGNDPYSQIYLQRETWWRMVDPALLDPAGFYQRDAGSGDQVSPWDMYEARIKAVQEFHAKCLGANDYFNADLAYFFFNHGTRSFSEVRWQLNYGGIDFNRSEIAWAPCLLADGFGSREIETARRPVQFTRVAKDPWLAGSAMTSRVRYRAWATLQPPGGDGDGTVPVVSGAAPASVIRKHEKFKGTEHDAAFTSYRAKLYSFLGILKLASRAVMP